MMMVTVPPNGGRSAPMSPTYMTVPMVTARCVGTLSPQHHASPPYHMLQKASVPVGLKQAHMGTAPAASAQAAQAAQTAPGVPITGWSVVCRPGGTNMHPGAPVVVSSLGNDRGSSASAPAATRSPAQRSSEPFPAPLSPRPESPTTTLRRGFEQQASLVASSRRKYSASCVLDQPKSGTRMSTQSQPHGQRQPQQRRAAADTSRGVARQHPATPASMTRRATSTGLAAKASTACARQVATGSVRRGASCEGPPTRFSPPIRVAERSLSVGVCLTEKGWNGLPKGTCARSSSALPLVVMTAETLAQQQKQQHSGTARPSARAGACSPSAGGCSGGGAVDAVPAHGLVSPTLLSGRRARKTALAGAAEGGSASGPIGGVEPEAEPSGSASFCGPGGAGLRMANIAGGDSHAPHVRLLPGHMDELDNASSDAREMLRSAQVLQEAPETTGGNMRMTVKLTEAELIRWCELQLLRPISTGSFGEVYLSTYKGQYVSVKRCILREDGSMTQEQLLNLEREINTYRALNHPAIVRYIGCVLEHPNLAIVTEFLPNGNVFDLLYMRRVNLPAAIRLKIARTVTQAIQYMHSCDPVVIHRDLKTQNLVLDADYCVKLCDFGKTQALWQECLPSDQDNGGSPRYMAPECFSVGGVITAKVDIWSLGCCIIEVLGGPLPYEDLPSMQQVLHVMLQERQGPMVPPWFSPVIRPALAQCFEFDPCHRVDVSEVLQALRRLTTEEVERHGMDIRRTC